MRRHALTVVLLSLVALAPLAGAANDRKKLDVHSVKFVGNHEFSPDDLRSVMVTRPSGFLSHHYYNQKIFYNDLVSVLDYYQLNGYLQVQIIDTSVVIDSAQAQVDITITVDEGELTRIEAISFFGNRFFSDSTLRKMVPLKSGGPFRRNEVQNGQLSILGAYADSGFLNAAVDPQTRIGATAHVADVDFDITEGGRCTIADIQIQGLTRTHRNVIMRELEFKKGDIVRYAKLLNSQRRIYMTGLFESVFVRPKSVDTAHPTQKIILIELKERQSSEFGVLLGYGSIEKVKGELQLMTDNLAGTGRKLGGSVNANFINRGATLSFSEPWTFGTRWRTDINLYDQYLTEPGFNLYHYGTKVEVGRTFGQHSSVSFSYVFENAQLSHVEVTDTLKYFNPKTRSLMLKYVRDTRDNLFNPLSGTYLEATQEIAGGIFQGNNNYTRTIVQGKWFHRLGRQIVFASGIELGTVQPFGTSTDIALSERFYAGGPTSIRSYNYQKVGPLDPNGEPLGGRIELVWHLAEFRLQVYKMFGMVGFVDVGNIWSGISSVRISHMAVAAGPGLRVNTPVGLLRLDWGINPDHRGDQAPSKLYFGMGQAF